MHEDASRTRQKRGMGGLFARHIREQITEKRGTTQAPSLCSAKGSGTTEQDMIDSEEQSMLKKRSFQW
jgi:hypothetical protein